MKTIKLRKNEIKTNWTNLVTNISFRIWRFCSPCVDPIFRSRYLSLTQCEN